jgi:sugar O-acyltransferase (sialic acid O-acetyltransferase NeuD family)
MNGRTMIVGGGGFAREVFTWVSDCVAAGQVPPIAGYLDDAGDVLAYRERYAMPYLGSIDSFDVRPDDQFVMALGSPGVKRAVHARLSVRGAQFPRIIHPTCIITPTCTIEEGVFLCVGCIIAPDSIVEAFVTMNTGSGTGHDAVVGAFSVLASRVAIGGFARIGEDVSIGSGVEVLPRIKIGRGATIGPGSVLYRSVPAGATVFAPPAKQLRLKK